MNQRKNNKEVWGRTVFRLAAAVAATVAILGEADLPAAHAQIKTVSVFSANTLTDSANANYNMNLTTVTNGGSLAYSNTVTILFSTSYDQATHKLGTLSTPTAAGTGNTYSGTASVSRDSGLASYDGGAVANAGVLSPFSSDTGGGSAGYYLFQVPFTLQASAGQAYSLNGNIHSDNAAFDVILDYGTGNQSVMTLTGTNISTTTNVATTNGVFRGSATQTALNANHTLSYVVYNNAGAMTASFNGYMATPEPSSLALLAGLVLPGGFAGAAGYSHRKRRRTLVS